MSLQESAEPNVIDHLTTAISGVFQWTGFGGADPTLADEPLNKSQNELLTSMIGSSKEDDKIRLESNESELPETGFGSLDFQKLCKKVDKEMYAMRQAESDLQTLEKELEKMYADDREKVAGKAKERVTTLPPHIQRQKHKIHKAQDALEHRRFAYKKLVRARELHLKNDEAPASPARAVLFSGRVVDAPSPEGPGTPTMERERSGLQDPFRVARRGSLTAISPENPANQGRRGSVTEIPANLLRRPSERINVDSSGAVPAARYGRRPSLEMANPPALARRHSEENISAGAWGQPPACEEGQRRAWRRWLAPQQGSAGSQ